MVNSDIFVSVNVKYSDNSNQQPIHAGFLKNTSPSFTGKYFVCLTRINKLLILFNIELI